MTNKDGPSDKGNRNNRAPDPGAWTRSEVEKDIAGLRNALDEHLRALDSSSSPPQTRASSPPPPPPPPRPSYQYPASKVNSSPGGSDNANRAGIVFFAVVSGLVFGIGIGFTAYMSSLGKLSAPPTAFPEGQGMTVKPSPTPQPKQARPAAPPASAPAEQPSNEGIRSGDADSRPEAPPSTDSAPAVRWQACLDQERRDAAPPQAGETWWPVVGPSDSLDDARRHCRADAFINRSGNAQISSFRDRETATAFAEQLTQDSSHPWRFWVGDASVR